MNSTTAATLATIFPIVVLTLVVDRDRVDLKLRRKGWFRWVSQYTIGTALLGLAMALILLGINDFALEWSVTLWTFSAITFLGFGLHVMMIVATSELADDEDDR